MSQRAPTVNPAWPQTGKSQGRAAGYLDCACAAVDHDDRPLGDVVPADELGDEAVVRPVEDLAGRSVLEDAAGVHHDHAVGKRQRLVLGMGDMHEGQAELHLEALELAPHAQPQERVERRKRLVEEQHLGLDDEGASQRHALALPAGKLRRQPRVVAFEADQREQLARLPVPLFAPGAPRAEAEGNVVDDVEMGEERVILEHHRGAARCRRQVGDDLVVDHDVPVARPLVAGDHPERRGLAAAGRPDQAAVAAGRNIERDRVDRARRAVSLGEDGKLEVADTSRRPSQLARSPLAE